MAVIGAAVNKVHIVNASRVSTTYTLENSADNQARKQDSRTSMNCWLTHIKIKIIIISSISSKKWIDTQMKIK